MFCFIHRQLFQKLKSQTELASPPKKLIKTIKYIRQGKGFRFCLHFHLLYYIISLRLLFFLNYLHLHTRGKAEAQYKYNHIPSLFFLKVYFHSPFYHQKVTTLFFAYTYRGKRKQRNLFFNRVTTSINNPITTITSTTNTSKEKNSYNSSLTLVYH